MPGHLERRQAALKSVLEGIVKTSTLLLSIIYFVLPSTIAQVVTPPERVAAEEGRAIPPERAAAASQALLAWLDCTECTDGELERVVRYGRYLEPALIETMQNGPSPARRAQIEDKLSAQFDANKWPPKEKKQFVDTYLASAVKVQRVRAIRALARLGTDSAKAALEKARHDPSAAIRAEIERALGSKPQPRALPPN